MDSSAQHVLPATNIFWLNILNCWDRMLFSESKMYFCLLLDFSYSLPLCFTRGVPSPGLTMGTYSVVLRYLSLHCVVDPFFEMISGTVIALDFDISVTIPGFVCSIRF